MHQKFPQLMRVRSETLQGLLLDVFNRFCSRQPENATELQVRVGGILATDPDPDAVYVNVSHVIPHPNYNSTNHQNDVGLLRLRSPVSYTDTILPICLPSPNVNLDQFKVCVDTGFGRTAFQGLSFPPARHDRHLFIMFILQ